MFRFTNEQRVCTIGGIKVGGQPGENPPLLIANMFQKGDRILESRTQRKFDRARATEYIRQLETLPAQTGVPALVAMVANTPDEIKAYVDFFIGVTDMPFAIDIWKAEVRVEAARYVAELGLQDRLLYNSITPWDADIPGQVAALKDMGIKHVVVQAFDVANKGPRGRITSLQQMLPLVEEGGFESILVDTAVMGLPTGAFSLRANRLVKEQFGLPVGGAPANGTYMLLKAKNFPQWQGFLQSWGREGFVGIDAGTHAVMAVLWSDFLLYGPMTGNAHIFGAVAAASAMLALLAYDEGAPLPTDERHPLNLLFPDVVKQLREERHS